jgi:hypothetical protein
MKVTVVPAQVTTVEDRIIGSLGFSQMMLLIVPVFVGAALFAILPPAMGSSVYKYTIMGILALVCCVLAIRIKGKILALWLITILRYNLRPKFYLFNKNTTAMREQYHSKRVEPEADNTATKTKKTVSVPKLELREAVKVYAAIDNPAAKLRFETTKKGGLHVRLTEVEE